MKKIIYKIKNMFDKLKQLKQLKEIEKNLKQEVVTKEKNKISITINGRFEILEIKLNPEISLEEQEKILKDCLNKAMKEIQLIVAKKMASASGFGF